MFVVLLLFYLFGFSLAALPGYKVIEFNQTARGFSGSLQVVNPSHLYDVDISPLGFVVEYTSDTIIHIKIFDNVNPRWEVPFVVDTNNTSTQNLTNPQYSFSFQKDFFTFSVIRKR